MIFVMPRPFKVLLFALLFASASAFTSQFSRRHSSVLFSAKDSFDDDTDDINFLGEGNGNDNQSFQQSNLDVNTYLSSKSSISESRINYNIPPDMLNNKRIHKAILSDLFASSASNKQRARLLDSRTSNNLMELSFVGVGSIRLPADAEGGESPCLFVAPNKNLLATSYKQFSAIAIPLSSARYRRFLPLLTVTYQNKPISKSRCLLLNSILVNYDDGLFDNLPWKSWTVLGRTDQDFDAAGNRVDEKFRFGKRDAYERFMGKDWPGRSFSIGNMAQLMLYEFEVDEKQQAQANNDGEIRSQEEPRENDTFDDRARQVLLRRILSLELDEAKSELAGAEQQLAVYLNNGGTDDDKVGTLVKLEREVLKCQRRAQEAQEAWNSLLDAEHGGGNVVSGQVRKGQITNVLQTIVNRSTLTIDGKNNTAPYRGAYGYAPTIDTRDEMKKTTIEQVYPYNGPLDLLIELIATQLRSNVIGTVLENTSLFDSVVQLGGACVLQRKPPSKGSKGSISISGETVDVPVQEKDDDINEEVKTGDIQIAECDAEEAIALSLAAGLPVAIEKELWESLNVPVAFVAQDDSVEILPRLKAKEEHGYGRVPPSKRGTEASSTKDSSGANDAPRTTSSVFASLFSSSVSSSSLFSSSEIVDKVPSLDVYDSLSIQEKAKILLRADSFKGKLPRPRIIRQKQGSSEPIDRLLIPLVDEAVRRAYLIREAQRRNDFETVEQLTKNKSKRQLAKELAIMARSEGRATVADVWEEEAEFRKILRADVTQDEGSYSSFLDKDEWYERERLARAKKLKKGNFGTLLDGLE